MSKKVAVIDGNSLMHRAYHAIQTPMTAQDGTPTNAVFGFMQMLCKFVEDVEPDALICAFDHGKPEFRMAEMPEYKAQRPKMDDELHVQFPIIQELLESMNVPVVKVKGWEGDDILGTIAARDEKLGFETLLVTGDKDACQLATDLTRIVTTKRGITDVVIYGPDEVMEKYGVTPEQFCDFLGLMGDSSDNIPGVPGIGPKSATTLLERFGSIEGVYEHLDELKGKQKENLANHKEAAYLSRQIATIVRDLDFSLDIEGASFPSFSAEDVTEAFEKYQLKAPLARVLKMIHEQIDRPMLTLDVGERASASDWRGFIERARERDEVIGISFRQGDADTIFGHSFKVAFATSEGHLFLDGDAVDEALVEIWKSARFAALDLKALIGIIYPPDTSWPARLEEHELFNHQGFSLSLAAYALASTVTSYTYEGLAQRFLGGDLPEIEDADEAIIFQATLCRLLQPKVAEVLAEDGSDEVYQDIDLPLVSVLAIMERTGVRIDAELLRTIGQEAQESLDELSARIFEQAGQEFNIDSPKQLSHILFDEMGLKPLKKNSRGFSTDARVLRELAKEHAIADDVQRYRELSKIKGTYIDSLPKMRAGDERVHTVFHETVTATGRLSSSDPNLQNIPVRTDFGRRIRECFVPLDEKSVFMSADYSQIELRLLAHFSGDEHLIGAFRSGEDFHASTAARVNGVALEEVTPEMRSRAKAVNFGIVYGQQAYGLSQTLDIPMGEAAEMIQSYFDTFPQVRAYLDDVVAQTKETGFASTLFGRKRHIPELRSTNKHARAQGERTAMNLPMQGTAADIIKLAMREVQERLVKEGFQAKMILQVHDELDFSAPEEEVEKLASMVKEAMENVVSLDVPLLADVAWGNNWACAH